MAVTRDGTILVSDGYCNSRVASFTASGHHLGDFVLEEGAMAIPHSLVLDECEGAILVADREQSRIHRFQLDNRKLTGKHVGVGKLCM